MNPDIYNNPIVQRVHDGTSLSSTDLCASCTHCVRRKGSNTGFEDTRCEYIGKQVPVKIAQCTAYRERGRMSLHDMSEIAYIIELKGTRVGFLSPEELKRRNGGDSPVGGFGR